jgi:hypothetical protein
MATRMTAIPSPLCEFHQPERGLARPARRFRPARQLVDGRRLDGVDHEQHGRSARATSTIRPTSCSRDHPDTVGRGPRQKTEARSAQADLTRRLPRPPRTARDRPRPSGRAPAAAWRQQRRLADPRLATHAARASPVREPPPRTRSSSPMPVGRRARSGVGDRGETHRARSCGRGTGLPVRRATRAGLIAMTVSDERVPASARAALAFPAG